ncbi:MAG: PEGA domain-containing protein [Nanoarchaeota archaeon]|nr:PEGA domain-containing protein [Nanoarchaeota archaeon]
MKKEVRIKNKFKFNNNILYLIIAIIVILLLIFGRQTREKIEIIDEVSQVIEESTGSGFLEIETFPSDAEIFIDGVSSGVSPTTIYNVDAGSHNVVIKKEGYEDFTSEVNIEAGRKTYLESRLIVKVVKEEEETPDTVDEKEEIVEIVEEENEETLTEDLKAIGTVNIGNKFLLYYDFSEGEFTEKRNFEQDIFSKRYKTYLVFTRFNPINVKTIDKSIDDVEKEDCVGIKGQFEWLYSGQSLCVITKENEIAAIGGVWDDTENAELTYKLFS